MSSDNKKKLFKTILTSHLGCGCGRPKRSDVYEPTPTTPRPIPQKDPHPTCSSSSSCCDKSGVINEEGDTSSAISLNIDNTAASTQNSESEPDTTKASKIVNSVAVVKDSDDPYQDFRRSMLQMILEKEIYARHDLEELLHCFLKLNSPCHHQAIVRAFAEILNELVSNNSQESSVDGGDSSSHGHDC